MEFPLQLQHFALCQRTLEGVRNTFFDSSNVLNLAAFSLDQDRDTLFRVLSIKAARLDIPVYAQVLHRRNEVRVPLIDW